MASRRRRRPARTKGGARGGDTAAAVVDVCANLLQYGLFEQGRLFGVPDILKPFVVDARVGPAAHVLAPPIYNGPHAGAP